MWIEAHVSVSLSSRPSPFYLHVRGGKTFDSSMASVGAELVHFEGLEWYGEVVDKHHRSTSVA